MPRLGGVPSLIFPALAFLTAIGAAVWAGADFRYVLVALIGAAVGWTEMMARYRDAPFKTLLSVPGFAYAMVNGLAAAAALYLVRAFDVNLVSGSAEKVSAIQVLIASVGAMTFFRSGVFNIRLGDTDVAIGPAMVLQVMLSALDRSYDRIRAEPRSRKAAELMAGISFARACEALPSLCFNLMQNVPPSEQQAVGEEIRSLKESTSMNNEAQAIILGLSLINVVGEKALEAAIDALGASIRGADQLEQIALQAYAAKSDPQRVVDMLPIACEALCHPKARSKVAHDDEVVKLTQLALPIENRAVLVIQVLNRRHGPAVVAAALASLSSEVTFAPAAANTGHAPTKPGTIPQHVTGVADSDEPLQQPDTTSSTPDIPK